MEIRLPLAVATTSAMLVVTVIKFRYQQGHELCYVELVVFSSLFAAYCSIAAYCYYSIIITKA